MKIFDKEALLRSTMIAGLAAASLGAAPTFAQDADETEQSDNQVDTVVVTGSLLRRSDFTSAAPIQVITAETASLAGLIDTSEILQDSTIAAGSTQINSQFGGFVINGGLGVNNVSLRGLGAQRTLVLFNGNRLGPAGTQGGVGAVDTNVIPSSIIQRVEILKDGASSIYGSDALAGVINVITRTEIEAPELSVSASLPFESGGESYNINGVIGRSFDRGYITASAEYNRFEALKRGDRDYLNCPEDYVFDVATGQRYDRIELNPLSSGQGETKCFNIGVTNAIDIFSDTIRRLILDPGSTAPGSGYFDGFRARGGNGLGIQNGVALGIQETQTTEDRLLEQDILPEDETLSIYLTGEYDLGFANFYGEFLYNNRQTRRRAFRQFFPWSGNPLFFGNGFGSNEFAFTTANDLGFAAYARPIALIDFNSETDIDYFYGIAGLEGSFGSNLGFLSDWTWDMSLSHSRSEGTYQSDSIDARNVLDIFDPRTDISHTLDTSGNVVCSRISDGSSCPAINYFSQDFILGNLTDEEYNFLYETVIGETVFTQTLFRAVTTGELFELPAGPVGAAFGFEYRESEIDDVPGELSLQGNQWGLSSAVETQGTDELYELYAEFEVPLLAGRPFFEELTLSLSGRYFDYDLYDADTVYKLGVNWQINPIVRARSTYGTSYRAPALFELYLGDQTGFQSQTAIDPCIDWGESTNTQIRTNCAAEGIPDNYAGVGSSALVTSSGGAGQLEPETSDAFTVGLVVTPTDINLSLALDYFEIEVEDQVSRLSAAAILGGCYGGNVFPNSFCDLFDRDTDPNSVSFLSITDVRAQFVNVNAQKTTGLDLTAIYEHDFDFGQLTINTLATWTFEDFVDLFEGADGFETQDFNGWLGEPDLVVDSFVALERGDWTFTWNIDFFSRQSNEFLIDDDDVILRDFAGPEGPRDVRRKIHSESFFTHGLSVRYEAPKWILIGGVTNIFGEEPSAVSTGVDNRLGNGSLSATQQDLRGRAAFVNFTRQF